MAKTTAQRAALRLRLINAQGRRCHYCGHRMGAAGGPVNRSNCVAACKVCNEAKADMPAVDFLAVLAEFKREAVRG